MVMPNAQRNHAAALLALLLTAAAPAAADPPASRQTPGPGPGQADIKFGVYAMGGQVFDVDLSLRPNEAGRPNEPGDKPRQLSVMSAMRSTGAANVFLRFQMQADLDLRLEPDGLKPLRYASEIDGSFSRRSITMVWGPDGLPRTELIPPADQDDRDPVPVDLTRNTLDPTTAILARSLVAGEQPCQGSDPIFDGRRRYNLHYSAVRWENLPAYRRSAYSGDALKCTVKLEPIAGYARKYMENTRRLENEVTEFWLARLPEEGIWLPVRLRSQWMLGEVDGFISAAALDGHTLLRPIEGLAWNPPSQDRALQRN